MSETLFRFLLSELGTVRVLCKAAPNGKACGHIVEMSISRLGQISRCPACGQSFLDHRQENRLDELRQVAEHLSALSTHFEVEFVLPQ